MKKLLIALLVFAQIAVITPECVSAAKRAPSSSATSSSSSRSSGPSAADSSAPRPLDDGAVMLPILMYHSLYKAPKGACTITPSAFEEDVRYLADNGYHTVGVSDLIAFAYDKKPLPDKPIMITFDDGYYNTYTQAFPLMKQYHMKLVLSIVGESTEQFSRVEDKNERYGAMNWTEINEMLASDCAELANHTRNLHMLTAGRKGCKRRKGESADHYEKMFTEDVGALQEECRQNCGVTPVCFTYPFGSTCPDALALLKSMGFKMTLTCDDGMNFLKPGDPEELFEMKREERTPSASAKKILQKITRAAEQKEKLSSING